MKSSNLDKIAIVISIVSLAISSYIGFRSISLTSQLNAMTMEPQLFLFIRVTDIENATKDTFLMNLDGFLQNRGGAFCIIESLQVDPYIYETRTVRGRHGGVQRTIRTQVENCNLSTIYFDPSLAALNRLDKDCSHNFTFSISVPRWALRATSSEFFIDLCFIYSFSSLQHKKVVTYESPHQTLGGFHVSAGASDDL